MIPNKYTVSDNNIHIEDSYTVSKKEFVPFFDELRPQYPGNQVLARSNYSLTMEWSTHNFLYNLHILRSHTKDVDLNAPQKWYVTALYCTFGPICWLFIK